MISAGRPYGWLAGALAAVLLTAGCSGGDEEPIETQQVGRGDVTEVVEAPATVAARAAATLTAPATGRVAELTVRDGDAVAAGQVLVRVDSPDAQAQLAQAQQADAEAAASAEVEVPGIATTSAAAERLDERAREAFRTARTSIEQIPDPTLRAQALAELAQSEADYAAARADADRAVRRFNAGLGSLGDALGGLGQATRVQTRAAVVAAQRTVDSLVVTSPIAGIVSLGAAAASGGGGGVDLSGIPAELQGAAQDAIGGGAAAQGDPGAVGTIAVGAPVTAGQTLASVTDVSTLSLLAEVDETDVLLVTPGVPAQAELDALPGTTYDATVTSVDVAPTASSRGGVSYRVRLDLGVGQDEAGAPAPAPRPGMSAVADLRVREVTGVVTVPVSAIRREGSRDAVFTVVDGLVRQRLVTLGAEGDATVEVVDGLDEGDTVVVRGADVVQDGDRLPE